MATAVEEFRKVSRAEVKPGEEDREFYRLTPGKKMIVMLGGPSMNLLIYLVLTVALLTLMGLPHNDPTTTVQSVSKCVVAADTPASQVPPCVEPTSPAAVAGLRPGDTVVSIDGRAVTSWDDLVAAVEPAADRPLHFVVDRNGQQVPLTITPVENRKLIDENGATKVTGFVGISPTNHHYYQPLSLLAVPGEVAGQIGKGLEAVGRLPAKIVSLWDTVFDGKPRDVEGAIGVIGISRLGGEFAQTNQLDVQDKVFSLIGLLASVNLLLFFLNLLPLLPLDGGHVAGALVEASKRGLARLRARRGGVQVAADGTAETPAHKQIFVDTAQMLPVMYAVGSVLILLTLLTFYADIFKPIRLFGG
jgi:membrane-associated protease RseP (regulator of RpoE activity)